MAVLEHSLLGVNAMKMERLGERFFFNILALDEELMYVWS